MSGTYKDLKAWQVAMDLVTNVYRHTSLFPKEEIYGLTSQLRRAAVSIASNIAEGKGRASDKEFAIMLGDHCLRSKHKSQLPIALLSFRKRTLENCCSAPPNSDAS